MYWAAGGGARRLADVLGGRGAPAAPQTASTECSLAMYGGTTRLPPQPGPQALGPRRAGGGGTVPGLGIIQEGWLVNG